MPLIVENVIQRILELKKKLNKYPKYSLPLYYYIKKIIIFFYFHYNLFNKYLHLASFVPKK